MLWKEKKDNSVCMVLMTENTGNYIHTIYTHSALTVAVHYVDLSSACLKFDIRISSGQDKVEVFWILQQSIHSNGQVEANLTRLAKSQLKW